MNGSAWQFDLLPELGELASQLAHPMHDRLATDPGPVNPEDNRRLSVYPQVEVEPTADVCPSGPARDAVDQGRDGRIIWAGSRSKPARQGRGRDRSFDSGHGNGPPAHPTKGPPGEPILLDAGRSCHACAVQERSRTRPTRLLARRSAAQICRSAPPDTLRTLGWATVIVTRRRR